MTSEGLDKTSAPISRRAALSGLLLAGAGATLAGCARGGDAGTSGAAASGRAASTTGRVRSFQLTAQPTQVDLGGQVVATWTYGEGVPGKALRATAGDRVKVAFTNRLPQATSVHWHGLAIRNDMDGVPGVTTPPVAAGGRFDFDFVVPDPGTHWFHPHTGLQLDHGLYAPFIIDDPAEPGDYDAEWVVVLDDWTDGVGPSPDQILRRLRAAGSDMSGMSGMNGMNGTNGTNGMDMSDGGDVTYSLYLMNGRTPADPDVLRAKPGERIRIRLINAAADTIFDVALGGHRMQVTHTDGYAVQPVRTASLRMGMGERYDVVVTAASGVFPLVATAMGKQGQARALLRTGAGSVPAPGTRVAELTGRPTTVADLRAAPGTALARRARDTTQDVALGGSMQNYVWTINGRTYDKTSPLTVRPGELTRLRFTNPTMMSHPMHVHGHTFQLGPSGGSGPRKDTVLVPPMATIEADLLADNAGRWMVHCHNGYHAEAGMMTRLEYRSA